jgi:DNA-directed RNA polymerase
MLDDKIALQRELEEESLGLGVKKYRENLIERGEDNLPPGMKLLKAAIGPLTVAIQQCVEEGLEGKASRSVSIVQYLSQFDADAVAFMAAKTVIHHLHGSPTVQKVAVELASRLEGMLNFDRLKEEDPYAHRRLMKVLKNHPGLGASHRHVVIRKQQKWAGVVRIKWGVGEKLRLGTLLVNMVCEVTGLAMIEKRVVAGGKTPQVLTTTEATRLWLEQSHARCELLSPYYMPMVILPRPWTGPYGGGYLNSKLRYPLIKTANKNYLEELSYIDMPMIYRTINALQDTAWTINKAVLAVMQKAWDGGGRIGKLPAIHDEPIPAKPYDNPDEVAPEVVKEWKKSAAKVHDSNFRTRSKRVQVAAKLWVAERFAQEERFYFPYALDWRGRAYPVSAGINPQGDDIAKSLLKFADGKPLGEAGAYWLAVHGAGCFGVDKVTFADRVQWVEEHHAAIIDSALNPLDGKRFWCEADSPYMFLAFCFEWLGYSMSGNEHVSHLQVAFDGTCNGLQNFSAMLRDSIGGKAVGLVPTDTPPDIYTEVAKRSSEIIAQDALGGSTVAQRWEGKITRKLTKRNTMTTPYGVSEYGMKDQLMKDFDKMIEDGVDFGFLPSLEDAGYLAEVNYRAISETVVAARDAMDWLQKAAKVAASNNLPISWVTPSGLPVLQSYRKVLGKRYDFDIEGKRFRMMLKIEGDELDRRRQSSGISPNFVHSLDAAHMMRTVDYCLDEGVTSFAMIHDSYGTHAADADTLAQQLRQAFVDQYSSNVLEDFRTQLVSALPPELAAKVPPIPPMGTLELSSVLDSEYFFA